jgi:hypothetical protein
MSNTFLQKSCHRKDDVEKYGTDGQTADNDIVRRMRFVCWVNTAIDMHLEYVIIIGFFSHLQWSRENPSMLKLICTLHVFAFFNHEISLKVTKQVETFR